MCCASLKAKHMKALSKLYDNMKTRTATEEFNLTLLTLVGGKIIYVVELTRDAV